MSGGVVHHVEIRGPYVWVRGVTGTGSVISPARVVEYSANLENMTAVERSYSTQGREPPIERYWEITLMHHALVWRYAPASIAAVCSELEARYNHGLTGVFYSDKGRQLIHEVRAGAWIAFNQNPVMQEFERQIFIAAAQIEEAERKKALAEEP